MKENSKPEQHAMWAISRKMSSATNEESLPHTEPYSQLIDSNAKKRMYIRDKKWVAFNDVHMGSTS